MCIKTLMCDNWEFSKNPIDTEYADNLKWGSVDIPHDYLIYDTYNLYETSTGWYRRKLNYKLDNKRTALHFDGVYMDSRVYVNGILAGEWKYGYTAFEFDVTELLHEGENLIAVRVDYREPNSRWYSGAGIYRKVWLKSYDACHITNDGIYISADIDGMVKITSEIERPENVQVSGMSVRNTIFNDNEKIISVENPCCAFDKSRISKAILRKDCKYSLNNDSVKLEKIILWDIENPHLYTCVTEVIRNGEIVDRVETRFGFRKIEFTSDKGFFLNDRHVKLHGCCEHHDLGCLGAASNMTAIKRKLEKLREVGINAIRTSHNPPSEELMELSDNMGFLILSEGFDMWELHKTEYDYAGFFKDWIEKDVASWIRRDRNHPSIIGWSIGNEIYDTHAGERGQEITSLLLGFVREHDPRKNGYVTIGSNYMQSENAQQCADIVKLVGYNYAERLYEEHHQAHPDWMIYGSETSSVVQSRGIYHFPLAQQILCEDDEQASALGNSTTGWAAKSTEACIIPDRDAEYCAGQFIWTGFDYIGEPTPYATKNSYFGQFDTAGFPKDSSYIFRSEWTDFKSAPFVHIYPYWDFCEGQPIDIRVASNAPRIELFFNGISIATKDIDHVHGTELTLDAQLEYTHGELLAIAYDENGNEIARDVQRSFGDTAQIRLTPDKTETKADGTDLIFIDISAYDKDNEFVANANNRVFVNVKGAGRLIGLDNGDSTDYEQYKGISRRLFSGKLLAVIAPKTTAGEIYVKVTSLGLPDCILTLNTIEVQGQDVEGVSANEHNSECKCDCPSAETDIPVRKIEFVSESRVFTPDRREIKFKMVAYPQNASYVNEIDYRITTALGIDSNSAEIKSVKDGVVIVFCKGDGEFYLRALCKNGTKKYHILTALPLSGKDIGFSSIDPYKFVVGGLFSISSENATNGIEHGVSFARGKCWFGFENVDFGKLGSDILTIPIYMNRSTPVKFRIYDGIPDEGGEVIGDYTYFQPSAWLTYNEPQIFELSKKLKNVHTITMESSDGFEIKGFKFVKSEKEFSEINATDNESIYGDKFILGSDEVTGIGNNVLLDFGEFDFSENSPSKIVITGKSQLDINSIHIIFSGETEKRVLAEFVGEHDYTEREYALDGIKGKCKVSFAFLPGSNFDFKAFRFIY